MEKLLEVIRKLLLVVVWVTSGGIGLSSAFMIVYSIFSGDWGNGLHLIALPLAYGIYIWCSRLVNWIFE